MCVRTILKQLMEHKYMQNSLTQALTTYTSAVTEEPGTNLIDECAVPMFPGPGTGSYGPVETQFLFYIIRVLTVNSNQGYFSSLRNFQYV